MPGSLEKRWLLGGRRKKEGGLETERQRSSPSLHPTHKTPWFGFRILPFVFSIAAEEKASKAASFPQLPLDCRGPRGTSNLPGSPGPAWPSLRVPLSQDSRLHGGGQEQELQKRPEPYDLQHVPAGGNWRKSSRKPTTLMYMPGEQLALRTDLTGAEYR